MTALTFWNLPGPKEWLVRRCINSFRNEYEFWPGYCERLLTLEELLDALGECAKLWPQYTFSGHKVTVASARSSRWRAALPQRDVKAAPSRRHRPRPAAGSSLEKP